MKDVKVLDLLKEIQKDCVSAHLRGHKLGGLCSTFTFYLREYLVELHPPTKLYEIKEYIPEFNRSFLKAKFTEQESKFFWNITDNEVRLRAILKLINHYDCPKKRNITIMENKYHTNFLEK